MKIIKSKLIALCSALNFVPTRIYPRHSEKVIKKELKGELIGVKIGTWKGKHAERMLKNLNMRKLYLIDPYEVYDKLKTEVGIGEQKKVDKIYKKMCMRLLKWHAKIGIIKKKSEDTVAEIPNELDFVYIDGCHDYESVKRDIENYYPKIRKGGLLMGHDFGQPELTRAVIEWVINNKAYSFQTVRGDWIVIK